MTYPAKPKAGDPVGPFISDTEIWSLLLDMLAAWRNGELGVPPTNTASVCTPIARNDGTDQLDARIVQQLDSALSGGNTEQSYDQLLARKPIFAIQDPTWHSDIDNVALLPRAILAGNTQPIRSSRYIPVTVENPTEPGNYAMIDPVDPTKLRRSSSGIFQIIGSFQNETFIVDTQEKQPFWIYNLLEDGSSGGAPYSATLKQLTFVDYGTIQIKDPLGMLDNALIGETGYCLHVGNDFYPITLRGREITVLTDLFADPDTEGALCASRQTINVLTATLAASVCVDLCDLVKCCPGYQVEDDCQFDISCNGCLFPTKPISQLEIRDGTGALLARHEGFSQVYNGNCQWTLSAVDDADLSVADIVAVWGVNGQWTITWDTLTLTSADQLPCNTGNTGLTSGTGETGTISWTSKDQPLPSAFGGSMTDDQLLRSLAGCRGEDAVALVKSWGKEKSAAKINELAKMIAQGAARSGKQVTTQEVGRMIQRIINSLE